MRFLIGMLVLVLLAVPCHADTTVVGPNTYKIDEGVDFSISNAFATNFLISWSDGSGTFTEKEDPHLVLVEGQTYTFTRTTSSHPFVITTDALPTTESNGIYQRATTDGGTIDGVTMSPIDEFTADPAPTTDFISWTSVEGDIGYYFYTCRITFHTSMIGTIQVVAKPVPTAEHSWSTVKAGYMR